MGKLVNALKAHPTGFWFIFWGELAERAAYYGMRAILALFLVDVMHFDDGKSGMVASFFSAGCYLLCLAGGWVSDAISVNSGRSSSSHSPTWQDIRFSGFLPTTASLLCISPWSFWLSGLG